jgi:hypothetical protein
LHLTVTMSRFNILPLMLALFSCQNKSDTLSINKDEAEILNLTLDSVIGSDTLWRYHLKVPPMPIPVIAFPDKVDSAEYLKIVRWRDSAKNILDTASLFISVYEENAYIAESLISHIKTQTSTYTDDTSFNEVLRRLFKQNLSKDSIDVALLKPKYNFKVFDARIAPNDRLRKIGSLRFSKIAFNETRGRACVYTSFSCGGLCGSGDIHFFRKISGKWIYVRTWELWVL